MFVRTVVCPNQSILIFIAYSSLFADNSPSTQINKVVSHPTLPLTVTAHEDRHIRFFDNSTGKWRFLLAKISIISASVQHYFEQHTLIKTAALSYLETVYVVVF